MENNFINFEKVKRSIEVMFNQYNGLVNICVPAKLEVSPIKTEICRAGYTAYPNIIIIYPTNIFTIYNYDIKKCIIVIIETIIHELFHIDQLINTTKILEDNEYRNNIESAVEFMTYTFITNNINLIVQNTNNLFRNINITNDDVINTILCKKRFNSINNFSWYNRKNIYDHIIIGVINMVGSDYGAELLDELINCFENQSKDLIFEINGNKLIILYKDELGESYIVDINTYNNFIYESYFKYFHHIISRNECGFREDNNSITLVINTKRDTNNMVSILN